MGTRGLMGAAQRVLRRSRTAAGRDVVDPCVRDLRAAIGADTVPLDGAGRYLDVARPGPDGKAVIDFNRAYNPPCAFTQFATCPLPPNENRLDLAITAGEKRYPPKKKA